MSNATSKKKLERTSLGRLGCITFSVAWQKYQAVKQVIPGNKKLLSNCVIYTAQISSSAFLICGDAPTSKTFLGQVFRLEKLLG